MSQVVVPEDFDIDNQAGRIVQRRRRTTGQFPSAEANNLTDSSSDDEGVAADDKAKSRLLPKGVIRFPEKTQEKLRIQSNFVIVGETDSYHPELVPKTLENLQDEPSLLVSFVGTPALDEGEGFDVQFSESTNEVVDQVLGAIAGYASDKTGVWLVSHGTSLTLGRKLGTAVNFRGWDMHNERVTTIGIAPLHKIIGSDLIQQATQPDTDCYYGKFDGEHSGANVTLNKYFTDFLLFDGKEWGDEKFFRNNFESHYADKCPRVVVMIGGDRRALKYVLNKVREGNVMILVMRSVETQGGGKQYSNIIAEAIEVCRDAGDGRKSMGLQSAIQRWAQLRNADPELAEIAEYHNIKVFDPAIHSATQVVSWIDDTRKDSSWRLFRQPYDEDFWDFHQLLQERFFSAEIDKFGMASTSFTEDIGASSAVRTTHTQYVILNELNTNLDKANMIRAIMHQALWKLQAPEVLVHLAIGEANVPFAKLGPFYKAFGYGLLKAIMRKGIVLLDADRSQKEGATIPTALFDRLDDFKGVVPVLGLADKAGDFESLFESAEDVTKLARKPSALRKVQSVNFFDRGKGAMASKATKSLYQCASHMLLFKEATSGGTRKIASSLPPHLLRKQLANFVFELYNSTINITVVVGNSLSGARGDDDTPTTSSPEKLSTLDDFVQHLNNGYHYLWIMQGSGGIADYIAKLVKSVQKSDPNFPLSPRDGRWVETLRANMHKVTVFNLAELEPMDLHDEFLRIYNSSTTLSMCNKHYQDDGISELVRQLRETSISDEALLFARKEKVTFGVFGRPDRTLHEFQNVPTHFMRLPCFNRPRALKQIRNFILHNWNLASPRVIISVAGDDEEADPYADTDSLLRLPERTTATNIKNMFQRTVFRLCDDFQGCVFTSAWHAGVNKLIGEAMSDGYFFYDVPLIGVCAWRQVERAEEIQKHKMFNANKLGPAAKTHSPDVNHTHFLFAVHNDDGEVLRFRHRIETVLETRKQVLMVIGGGDQALRLVRLKMEAELPIIVVQGTGGAADALAFEFEQSRRSGNSRAEVPRHIQGSLQLLRKLIPIDLVQEFISSGKMFCVDIANPKHPEVLETSLLQALNETPKVVDDAALLQATRVNNLSMKMTLTSIKLGLICQLDLSDNQLGDVAADLLSQVLETNQKLHTVNLSNNKITDKGCRYLASGLLANRSVETMYLDGNRITPDGANELDCMVNARGIPIDFNGIGLGVEFQREMVSVFSEISNAVKQRVMVQGMDADDVDDILEGLRTWPVHSLIGYPNLLEFFLRRLHRTLESRKSIGLLLEFKFRVDLVFLGIVTCPDSGGETPLHRAVSRSSTRSLEILVTNVTTAHKSQLEKHLLQTQHVNGRGSSSSLSAPLPQVLNKRGSHPLDVPNEDGETPLHIAVRQGNLAGTACLVSHSANFSNGTEQLAISPFQWALENQKHFEDRKTFLDAWGETDDKAPFHELADDIVEVMRSKVERTTLNRSAFLGFCARFSLFGVFLVFLVYIAIYSSTTFGQANLLLKIGMDDRLVDREFQVVEGGDVLKTYWDINTAQEWWRWMEDVVLVTLYPTNDNSGAELDTTDRLYANQYNRLIGGLRIRQLRVDGGDCTDIPVFLDNILPDDCFFQFSEDRASKQSFGPSGVWKWQSENQLKGGTDVGYRAYMRYPGSGFVVDIPPGNRTAALEMLSFLRTNDFIDKQTRTLMVEYLVFNANTRTFLSASMMTEFFSTSMIVTTSRSVPIRFWGYYDWDERKDGYDIIAMIAELYVFAVGLLFALDEVLEFRNALSQFSERRARLQGWLPKVQFRFAVFYNHIRRNWNAIDYGGLVMLFTAISIRLYGHSVMHDLVDGKNFAGDTFINAAKLRNLQEYEHEIISLAVLLYVLKVIKYLCLLPVLGPFVMSIAYTVTDRRVFMFTFIFFWMIAAFALSYLISFGYQLDLFDRYDFMLTVLRVVFGEFGELSRTQSFKWFLAPVYWVAVLIVLSLAMLNIFIALIGEAYTENLRDAQKSYKHWETYVLQMKSFSLKQRFLASFAPAISRFLFKDTNLNENFSAWSPPFWTEETIERYKGSSQFQSRDELVSTVHQLRHKVEEVEARNLRRHSK